MSAFVRWLTVLVILPIAAWTISYLTFPAAKYEDFCMRTLDVDTPPVACIPALVYSGIAMVIMLFQWVLVAPLAAWVRHRGRSHSGSAANIQRSVFIITGLIVSASVVRQALSSDVDDPMSTVWIAVTQFCLPLIVLIVPSMLLFTARVDGATDGGAS